MSRAAIPDTLVAAGVNLALDALAVEVSSLLAGEGVRAVVLKGSSLTGWLYGENSTRFSRDLDLLVDPATFGQAEQLLERGGFQPQVPWRDDRTARHWRREDSAFEVDLHRTLVGVDVSPKVAWDTLSGHTERLDVAGGTIEILDPSARAMVLALHAAKHQSVRGQPLDDLEQGLAQLPDALWADAAELAATLDAVPAFATGLRRTPAGEALADRLALSHRTTPEVALLLHRAPGSVALNRLVATRGIRAKLRFGARRAFPDPDAMRAMDPLAKRGAVGLTAAYAKRAGWLVAHALPAARAVVAARRQTRRDR
jgi:hypothetical protein